MNREGWFMAAIDSSPIRREHPVSPTADARELRSNVEH
jgi:hypothetical protein